MPDWRTIEVGSIVDLRIADDTFSGTRPTRTGRHIEWDELYATVTPR